MFNIKPKFIMFSMSASILTGYRLLSEHVEGFRNIFRHCLATWKFEQNSILTKKHRGIKYWPRKNTTPIFCRYYTKLLFESRDNFIKKNALFLLIWFWPKLFSGWNDKNILRYSFFRNFIFCWNFIDLTVLQFFLWSAFRWAGAPAPTTEWGDRSRKVATREKAWVY